MEELIITCETELQKFIKDNSIAVVYFSTSECNVCKVLKPKLKEFLAEDFPKIKFAYVDLNNSREITGQHTIFTVPAIIFYVDGSETLRESRNINLNVLHDKLSRPYQMIFGE